MKETNSEPLWGERPEPFTLLQDLVMNWWVILLAGLAGLMLATVAAGTRYTPRYPARATYAWPPNRGQTPSATSRPPIRWPRPSAKSCKAA